MSYANPTIHGDPRLETDLRPRLTLALIRQRIRVTLVALRARTALAVLGPNGAVVVTELRLRVHRKATDEWVDYGVVSRRVVADAGVSFLCTDWYDGSTDITNFNYHGFGTGAAAEAVGDVALGAEVETPRGAGTKSKPAAYQLQTVQTHTFAGSFTITEHGLFSATTSTTLWDRSVFTGIGVASGDSIQATYTLTVTSGG